MPWPRRLHLRRPSDRRSLRQVAPACDPERSRPPLCHTPDQRRQARIRRVRVCSCSRAGGVLMTYDATRAHPPAKAPLTPATPLATPPARLLSVIGAASFQASPSAALRASGDALSPDLHERNSSKARYAKIAAAAAGAMVGAAWPRSMPTLAAAIAPEALHTAMITLTRGGRRLPASATERPTAKLSVELEKASTNASAHGPSGSLSRHIILGDCTST